MNITNVLDLHFVKAIVNIAWWWRQMMLIWFNPYCDEFISGKTKTYLNFASFLNTEMMQVIQILAHGGQRLWKKKKTCYPLESILWLLLSWCHKEPGHRQPCYWHILWDYFIFSTRKLWYWYMKYYLKSMNCKWNLWHKISPPTKKKKKKKSQLFVNYAFYVVGCII